MKTANPFLAAESCLLAPFDLNVAKLSTLLSGILSHDVDDADLYFQYSRAESWSLEEGIVKSGSFHIDQGVGVRAVSGEKTAFAYSDDLSFASIEKATKTVSSLAHLGKSHTCSLKKGKLPKALYSDEDPIASLDATQKVTLLQKIESYARALDPRVKQVMANLSGEYEVILIASADGNLSADIRPLVRMGVTVVVEEKGRKEQGHAGGGARSPYAFFDDAVLQQYAKEAVHQAITTLEAISAPAGLMTVVLGSGWPGILLHEAVGHGLEGDFNRKGSSTFSGQIGKRVAAKGVTVIDDGTLQNRRGSLTIDDEGTPSQRNVLIEDGILVKYLQDALNARLMNVPKTGNGRRESFAHLPLPRMTNTFMLEGGFSQKEIIASVKKGVYAANFGGGQVDITNGKFVFSMSEAYEIENGKIGRPLKGATLIGSGPEVMQQISMIGNDLSLDAGVGTCGKDGQSVPVGVGQPTLRIDEITVGGTG